jgi:carboxyl-terminal processing protease
MLPMSRSKKTTAVAALLLLPIIGGGFLLQGGQQGNLLNVVINIVGQRYVDTLTQQAVMEKAARGLVEQLNDPYSELMSLKQNEDFTRGATGRYGGTGMYIGLVDGWVMVDRVFPNTPAEDAGVVEGDRIIQVDTTHTKGLPLEKVSTLLRGEPGTKVKVTYSRPGIATPLVYDLTRREIHIPAVLYSTMLGDKVGYIPLQTFNENASAEVVSAVQKLRAEGAKSLILDLRDNPGGIVDQALEISSLFLRDGQPILTVRTRDPLPVVDSAQGPHIATDLPLMVLVDDGSASASEIVAGALQDHDRALLLGTTSYGKGLVQGLYGLPGGFALKITTGKWFTPSGRTIHRDRKVLPDGRYVEVVPDSLEKDSVRTSRPTFKSDSGRTVYGGGGITPDVIVPTDTLTTAEQELSKAIAPKGAAITSVLRDYSLELKTTVQPGFTAPAAWTTELFKRFAAAGVEIEPKYRAVAEKFFLHDLEIRVARQAFGDAEVRKRTVVDDPQLSRALDLLKGATTQKALFTSVRR